jgi:hypothetical protein
VKASLSEVHVKASLSRSVCWDTHECAHTGEATCESKPKRSACESKPKQKCVLGHARVRAHWRGHM